jgi:hypothetical protein
MISTFIDRNYFLYSKLESDIDCHPRLKCEPQVLILRVGVEKILDNGHKNRYISLIFKGI